MSNSVVDTALVQQQVKHLLLDNVVDLIKLIVCLVRGMEKWEDRKL